MKIPSISPMTTVLSALDNEGSLWPLLVKDVIDSTGRTAMEYRRGGHGADHAGRERMVEEYATTAVWVGGRKAIAYGLIYPMMRLAKFALDPKVDIMLFMKKPEALFQKVPQWIAGRKQAYWGAQIAQFVIGTMVPVVIIGWFIPKMNQTITRLALQRELHQQKHGVKSPDLALSSPAEPSPATNSMMLWNNPVTTSGVRLAQTIGTASALNPWMPSVSGNWQNPYGVAGIPGYGGVRFGSKLAENLVKLTTSDFWGNVFVDAGISSGRLYNARNWADRTEVGIREGSVILFLYILGDYIKGKLRHLFDNTLKSVTGLSYDALGWLKSKTNPILHSEWRQSIQQLKHLQEMGPNAFEAVEKLLDKQTGTFTDPILELARQQGLIHRASSAEKYSNNVFRHIFGADAANTAIQYRLDPRKLLDLDAIYETLVSGEKVGKIQKLKQLVQHYVLGNPKAAVKGVLQEGLVTRILKETQPANLTESMQQLLKRSYRWKGVAMASSYVVSCLGVGIIAPMIQHAVTRHLTGSSDFPGVKQNIQPTPWALQAKQTAHLAH